MDRCGLIICLYIRQLEGRNWEGASQLVCTLIDRCFCSCSSSVSASSSSSSSSSSSATSSSSPSAPAASSSSSPPPSLSPTAQESESRPLSPARALRSLLSLNSSLTRHSLPSLPHSAASSSAVVAPTSSGVLFSPSCLALCVLCGYHFPIYDCFACLVVSALKVVVEMTGNGC